ncbi:MAG: hypothetical protein WCI11_14340, partial [Candidatus Methylumidiphilus sp.]
PLGRKGRELSDGAAFLQGVNRVADAARRKYGERMTLETLTDAHLKSDAVEKDIRTRVYQAQAWHRNFPELLNVVIIVKNNLKTGRCAKVLLFSDDLGDFR